MHTASLLLLLLIITINIHEPLQLSDKQKHTRMASMRNPRVVDDVVASLNYKNINATDTFHPMASICLKHFIVKSNFNC